MTNDILKDFFQSINDSYTKMFEMKSLYISEHKKWYKVGDYVVIENGKLILGELNPTHKIMLLEGTLTDSKHSITLRDLWDGNTLKIDL